MRVLLVTMYWPPAGGAGVQRPLKTAAHLAELGVEVHVLAPDDPKWLHRDERLRDPDRVTVHRSRNLGPAARRPAEELYGRRGLAWLTRRVPIALRALLVPDGSVLWNATAIPAAVRLVRRERIDVVLTTSPPGSVHLVGLAARAGTDARWVADLRDSIGLHAHRRRDVRGEAALARLVARRADVVVAASEAIAVEMRSLAPAGRLAVVENGCDFDDFDGLAYEPGPRFRITHTGSFFGRRDPRPFLEALGGAKEEVVARFVGDFRSSDRAWAEARGLGERLELVPYLPREEALSFQRDSEALLLLVPEADGRGRGILSGKVFEYLAAGRPILALVPPDGEAARVIRETGAGIVVRPDDVSAIRQALDELAVHWRGGSLDGSVLDEDTGRRLSRRARVEELAAILGSLE